MKKLTTLFILAAVFVFGLFAEPKVPKMTSPESSNDTNRKYKEPQYFYLSNDCQNMYTIQAVTNVKNVTTSSNRKLEYMLWFHNTSLIYNSTIKLEIYFETEKQLDNFIDTIHLSDLENEFKRIRALMIKENTKPIYTPDQVFYDCLSKPKTVLYQADGSFFKY